MSTAAELLVAGSTLLIGEAQDHLLNLEPSNIVAIGPSVATVVQILRSNVVDNVIYKANIIALKAVAQVTILKATVVNITRADIT